uniref:Uncharacterized protein n=1 Tax=Arundo donax TaxID=35708 RepID=A0A0A9B4J2_ARUDO
MTIERKVKQDDELITPKHEATTSRMHHALHPCMNLYTQFKSLSCRYGLLAV